MTAISEPLCELIVDSVEPVQVFIAQNEGQPTGSFHIFQKAANIVYEPYSDDFGPMNISSTICFIRQLEEHLSECAMSSCSKLVYSVDPGRRSLSNAVVLLGSYLILIKDMPPGQVAARFAAIRPERLEDFRDAQAADIPAEFGLTLRDVWDGLLRLYRAKQCTWIDRPSHDHCPYWQWGQLDIKEYENYDSPANGDLHELVPGKLIAFRGPHDLGGAMYSDDPVSWTRKFSPAFYVETFEQLGVTDVVRHCVSTTPSTTRGTLRRRASATTTSSSTSAPSRRAPSSPPSSASSTRRAGRWQCIARRGWTARAR